MTTRRLVVGAVVIDDVERPSLLLAARRIGTMAGYWEFPGGKVEPGETPQRAVVRELKEELDVRAEALLRIDPPGGGRWPISARLEMELWVTAIRSGVPVADDSHDEVRWVGPDELETLNWLPSDRAALPLVAALLR